MKINYKNISQAIKSDNGIREDFINTQQKTNHERLIKNNQLELVDINQVNAEIRATFNQLMNPNCKRYIITKTAMDVIERIKIDNLDMNLFNKIPHNQVWEFMIDAKTCYRTYYDGDMLRGIYLKMSEEKAGYWFNYDSWGYELHSEENVKARETPNILEDNLKDKVSEWVRILIFLQFSEPILEVLEPNRKYGTNRLNRIKNESKSQYIVVNSKWNTVTVRSDGFRVRGHFRLQPCGQGMKERKLILIDEFEKKGYVRNSGKMAYNEG